MKQWDVQLAITTPEEVDFDEIMGELDNYSSTKLVDIEVINGHVVGFTDDLEEDIEPETEDEY